MAQVDLGRAVIALLADPAATQVVIPSLAAMTTTFEPDKTFVRFAGDTYDTAFRGEGRRGTYALTCLFPRSKHEGLADLLRLLQETAPDASDSRLLLRTHVGLVPGLNPTAVCEVEGPVAPVWTAAMVTVPFTVRLVQYDPAA